MRERAQLTESPSAVPYFPLFFLSKNYFFLFLFSAVMSASVSMMTAVSALMIVMLMMATYGIRIVVQCSGDKRFYLCICVSLCARVKPDVRFCKCISGTTADSSADQYVYTAIEQESCQRAMSLSLCVILYVTTYNNFRIPTLHPNRDTNQYFLLIYMYTEMMQYFHQNPERIISSGFLFFFILSTHPIRQTGTLFRRSRQSHLPPSHHPLSDNTAYRFL